jgi:hypothetical protein
MLQHKHTLKLAFQQRFSCGAKLSDKIVEVIIKNTCFQYERSLATRSEAIFIALTKSNSNRHENAGGSDVAILYGMIKWRQKLGCAASYGNTEVTNRCRKLRCIAIGILTLYSVAQR